IQEDKGGLRSQQVGIGLSAHPEGDNLAELELTARLEGVARICEIAGIVIGTAVGAHPLVMACVKRLVHDEFNDLLAKELEQIPDTIEQMLHYMDVDRRPAQDEAPRPAPPVPARPN